jgi:hypothetical protein
VRPLLSGTPALDVDPGHRAKRHDSRRGPDRISFRSVLQIRTNHSLKSNSMVSTAKSRASLRLGPSFSSNSRVSGVIFAIIPELGGVLRAQVLLFDFLNEILAIEKLSLHALASTLIMGIVKRHVIAERCSHRDGGMKPTKVNAGAHAGWTAKLDYRRCCGAALRSILCAWDPRSRHSSRAERAQPLPCLRLASRRPCHPIRLIRRRWPSVRITALSPRPSRKISLTRATLTMTER